MAQLDRMLSFVSDEPVPGPAQPPMPAVQPGAEAPIAPAKTINRDIFTQMGVPAPELDALAAARGKAQAASNAALLALDETGARRGQIREQVAGMTAPDAPNLLDLPEAPPEASPTDTLRVFGEFLPVLAILGGALSKKSATAALNAASGAMQAAKDNDTEALQRSHDQFKLELERTLQQNELGNQKFQNALSLFNTDMAKAQAELQALAGEEQNPILKAQLAQGDASAIAQMVQMRVDAWSKLNDALMKMDAVNAKTKNRQTVEQLLNKLRNNRNVLEEIAKARALAGQGETGFIGGVMSGVGGTKAKDLAATLDQIKANIGFDTLAQMRANSPTGGALGSITENELRMLQSVVASLDQSQSQDQFLDNLNKTERQYLESMAMISQAFEQDFGAAPASPPSPSATTQQPALADPLGIR